MPARNYSNWIRTGSRVFALLLVAGCFLTLGEAVSQRPAEMLFDKVELRTTFGAAEEGRNGRLAVSGELIRFLDKSGREFFSIPSAAVTDLFYSRVSGRRIKTAIFVSPLLLFSKGKKHYLTVSFDDGAAFVGAVEFRLDKKNYRGILRAVESVSNVTLEFDQEGIKDEKETVAERTGEVTGASVHSMAVLELTSDPEAAEIEIDGTFAGTTPRSKSLNPGKYKIKLTKKGFDSWEREIELEPGETVPIHVELERD
jgi:hypothetical protein